MALRINFNAEATTTHTALLQNERAMNKSLLRISTGNRILSAADDAAGLFIADQLSTVAAALNQGNSNIQTGISALQIAETNVGQIFDKLQTIYTKAQSAANDINDPNARAALQSDITNLVDAIQKIATDTEYNGIKLLDGTFENKSIHYGPRANQTITVGIAGVTADKIGASMVEGKGSYTSSASSAYSALISGNWQYNSASDIVKVANKPLSLTNGAVDAKSIADAINNNSELKALDISARAQNISIADNEFVSISTGANQSATLNFYVGPTTSSPSFSISIGANDVVTLDKLVSEINNKAAASNSEARITASKSGNKLVLTTEGQTIGLEVISEVSSTAGGTGPSIDLSTLLQGATHTVSYSGATNGSSTGSAVKVGDLVIIGSDSYSYDFRGISTASEGLGLSPTDTSKLKTLNDIKVNDNASAELAIDIANTAIKKVDRVRTQIGSVINNLQAIYDGQKASYDNTKEAENVIRNTDFASEMSTFTTMQIRMQAGMAMLAQANSLPQLVLQLLR